MDDKIEIEDPNERHTGQVIIEWSYSFWKNNHCW
jgi:hypothetical protein